MSLKGFSGIHVLNKMDKHFNIIVIITTEDVIPLSFETIDQRADWLAQLQGHYGKGNLRMLKGYINFFTLRVNYGVRHVAYM